MKARDLLKFGNQCEMVVHNIFSYASTHVPCVLFFDEVLPFTFSDRCVLKYHEVKVRAVTEE